MNARIVGRSIGAILLVAAAIALWWFATRSPIEPLAITDACQLLDDGDVRSAQGEPPTARKSSRSRSGDLEVSQCYIALPTPSKSISVTLTFPHSGAGAKDVDDAWRAMSDPEGREREGEGEGADAGSGPEAIAGVGDAALWVSSPIGGVLYARRHGTILSISVGGPGAPSEKKQKSLALARAALAQK